MRNSIQILVATAIVGGILGLANLYNTGGRLWPEPEMQPPSPEEEASPPTASATAPSGEEPAPGQAPSSPPATGTAPPPGTEPPPGADSSPTPEAPSPPASAEAIAPPPAAPATPPTTPPQGAAVVDLEAGKQVYRKCQACHALEPGRNRLGPSLAGVVGRKAGAVEGYKYSQAMLESGLTWDEATLDAYLKEPQKVVPGNKMPFPGLKTDNQRREVIAYLTAAAGGPPQAPAAPQPQAQAEQRPATPPPSVKYIPDVRYTLRTGSAEGRPFYLGVGGAIDGRQNPPLAAVEGQVVQVTLINGDGREQDIVFPGQGTRSPRVVDEGAGTSIAFRASAAGEFAYHSSLPGQREAGLEGSFVVTPRPPPESIVQADISRDPADLPPPIGLRQPETVRLDLVTVEQEARLADGTTYIFWTFNGRVPGPFVRVRVGDTIEVHVKNADDSSLIHSVDFHAATGPGGGAASLQVDPGQEKSMRWKALVPGLYVYHCATPMVAHHIASGMYGLILVEPEGGLPPVDREFYVMQGEIYTDAPFGQHGSQEFSVDRLLDEDPEYFVFNGSVGALSQLHPLKAKVGETVRIFFGVGGPNFTSSFHVIGEIFDRVYGLGGVLTAPVEGIQTVNVPAGGSAIAEFKLDVPGNYILVDHSLSRAERGLVGTLTAEGEPDPEIYDGVVTPGMGH